MVIADEAQRIKNRNDTSDALKGLRRARSWALTGTPVENHEEELASILEFVDHDDSGTPRAVPAAALNCWPGTASCSSGAASATSSTTFLPSR